MRGRPRKYHFGTLRPGDSFTVPLRHGGHRTSIAAAAWRYGKDHGMKFRTEVVSIGSDVASMKGINATRYANAVRVTRLT